MQISICRNGPVAGFGMLKKTFSSFRNPWQIAGLGVSLAIMFVCETFLIFDVVVESFGIHVEFYEKVHIAVETTAVLALAGTLMFTGVNYLRIIRENREFRSAAGIASGEFVRILEEKFAEWNLSAIEREISLLLIKGLSIQEIVEIRMTRPGTIKSQCNSIYRKAGVKGRNELVAYFVEDLMLGQELTP
jgi:DNA-binding CsgD family transcriptional regulator